MRVRAAAKLHPARLYIFDLLAAQERDPSGAPRSQRKEKLRDNGRTRARGKRGLTAAKATASMRHAVAAGTTRAVAGRTCAAHARCRDRHARGPRAALRTRCGIVALGDAANDFECAAIRTIVIVDRHDVSTRRRSLIRSVQQTGCIFCSRLRGGRGTFIAGNKAGSVENQPTRGFWSTSLGSSRRRLARDVRRLRRMVGKRLDSPFNEVGRTIGTSSKTRTTAAPPLSARGARTNPVCTSRTASRPWQRTRRRCART